MRHLYGLLSRKDWVYLAALLVPLVCYDLALKLVRVLGQLQTAGTLEVLGLMRSDLLFNLGYAVFWIGVFTAFRRGMPRKITAILFHVTSVFVVLLTTSAHVYFLKTGSMLEYGVVAYSVTNLNELKGLIGSHAPTSLLLGLVPVLLYLALGPWLLSRLVGRSHGATPRSDTPRDTLSRRPEPSLLYPVSAFLLALGFVGFSISGAGAGPEGRSFARDAVVNLAMSKVHKGEVASHLQASNVTPFERPTDTRLVPTPGTQKKNVVFIHLESTRAESVTPYNPDLNTTPYLNELAKRSIFAGDAYTIVPHSSKALTAINCGIYPHLTNEITEAKPGGVPANCLPKLLGQQGYNTVTFQSATSKFEDRSGLLDNLGYQQFFPLESLPKKGFEKANYFGKEDNIMLKPSEQWIKKHSDRPFMMNYIGVTGHDGYLPLKRYGTKHYTDDAKLNRYLNDLNYLDHYVKNVMDMYKRLGLYDNTVFVIYGDHGEGFGEHGLYQHDNTIYTEGIKIPLMVVDPGGRYRYGKTVSTPTNELDIMPTVLNLLGYKATDGGGYKGRSMLATPDEHRTLHFSCWDDYTCLASVKDNKEYIYFFGNKPAEVYDLQKDPQEKNDIADTIPREMLNERRAELLQWYSKVNATYEPRSRAPVS